MGIATSKSTSTATAPCLRQRSGSSDRAEARLLPRCSLQVPAFTHLWTLSEERPSGVRTREMPEAEEQAFLYPGTGLLPVSLTATFRHTNPKRACKSASHQPPPTAHQPSTTRPPLGDRTLADRFPNACGRADGARLEHIHRRNRPKAPHSPHWPCDTNYSGRPRGERRCLPDVRLRCVPRM